MNKFATQIVFLAFVLCNHALANDNANILSEYQRTRCANYGDSANYCREVKSSHDFNDTSDAAQTYLNTCPSVLPASMICRSGRVRDLGRMKQDYLAFFQAQKPAPAAGTGTGAGAGPGAGSGPGGQAGGKR